MKKIVLVALLVCAMSSMAMASPLTDYSKGNAALDINYRNSSTYDVNAGPYDGGLSFDGKHNLEWGLTYGIGNNWALQYRQANPEGKLTLWEEGSGGETASNYGEYLKAKIKVKEFNILYKMDKNFSLFTGLVNAKPRLQLTEKYGEESYSEAISGDSKNIWQFGFIATAPIADKLSAYGLASFGSDYRNWEAGLGYEIAKNLELNVNYRDMKIDDMSMKDAEDVKFDTKIKGWGLGVTYKF